MTVTTITTEPRVDANGTMLRLRALQVMGHGSARVARAIGYPERTVQKITRGVLRTVPKSLRSAVAGVYDELWDLRAPEGTPEERCAAQAARRRAERGGWCAPLGLDDQFLDVPGYRPTCGYRPATGVGVAYPPAIAS